MADTPRPTQNNTLTLELPPFPPDHIFKFKKNRAKPEEEIWGKGPTGTWIFVPDRIEYKEGEGNFVYYKYGVKFPSKCAAPVEMIYAINPIKRNLVSNLKLLTSPGGRFVILGLFLAGKKRRKDFVNRFFKYFNETADMSATPFYLDDGYYCKFVKELRKGIESFLKDLGVEEVVCKKTSEVIGMLFEYDNAYRFPAQDVLSEAFPERLLKDFPSEAQRLLKILEERDNSGESNRVSDKFAKAIKLLKILWYVPRFKKAIKNAIISIDWDKIRLDEADIYHMLLYSLYDVKGMNESQKISLYKVYHGEDMNKWPIRMFVQSR